MDSKSLMECIALALMFVIAAVGVAWASSEFSSMELDKKQDLAVTFKLLLCGLAVSQIVALMLLWYTRH